MVSELKRRRTRRRVGALACRFGYDRGLHRCARCRRPFVTLDARCRAGATFWQLSLRCAECGHQHEQLVPHVALRAFEQRIALQVDEITATLKRIERERMQEELELLVAALSRDLIDASDFAVPRAVASER